MSNSPLLKAPGSLVLKGQTDGQLVSWDSASGRYVPTSDLVVDPATGFVGIGTDTPTEELTVDGTLRLGVDVTGDSNLALFSSRSVVSIMESGSPTCKIILVNTDSTGELNAPRIGSEGDNFIVETNDEERLRVDENGNVGIGSGEAINARLKVEGETSDDTQYSVFVRDSSGAFIFGCRNDGFFSAPEVRNTFTTSNAPNVHVATNGAFYRNTSSSRYKREIVDMPYGLEEAMLLRPVTYKGKNPDDGDKVHGGLIAEEVHDVGLTDFVEYNEENEPDALEYANMVALAFKAIQELAEKVEQLESRL